MGWMQTKNEDLKVGDVIYLWTPNQRRRIMAINPYKGPLSDIILATLDLDIGIGLSIERGGYTEVLR